MFTIKPLRGVPCVWGCLPVNSVVCEASGGFYAGVSNADDIVGQIVLAKSKVLHECMHDAKLEISGVKVFDTTDSFRGKVYRGQQLVVFGRYERAGRARITLKGRITGEDRTYTTEFDFHEAAAAHAYMQGRNNFGKVLLVADRALR